MRRVRMRINTWGRHSKFGKDVYRISTGARLLERNGWTPVRRPRQHCSSYRYLRAPEGKATNRPVIEIDVPDDDEVRELAASLHATGEAWEGEAYGWPAIYLPERDRTSVWRTNMPCGRERVETNHYRDPARFEIGESGVWHVFVAFEPEPRWIWETKNIIGELEV